MASKIQDLRSITPRSNGTRTRAQVKNIARHHSGGNTGSWSTFWPFWRDSRGWGTGGYHEIILRDGTRQICYDDHEITNGVAGQNTGIYHICLVGNGNFTAAQEAAWDESCRDAMRRFKLPVSAVRGHNEFPGTNTQCPGINMNLVRSRLNGAPVPVSRDYLINGDNNSAVAKLQADLNKTGVNPPLATDGIFGPATERAVRSFQSANNLAVDGVWGMNSAAKMTVVLEQLNKPVVTPTPPVKPAEKPKEENELDKELIVINSANDYITARKLSVRRKIKVIERAAVSGKMAQTAYIVGGSTKGIEGVAEKLVDLSGPTWEGTVRKVEEFLKK
ncbi:N-acetylmuramoyl-L-alanine amidase [Planococcus dechangensis]|uniref:N-acetylmuramoyl-L-alanine amidase n=1 Tax=Planococcus dechangensis TaxID=1176255 RepID=A0ABV9M8V4_9BACL